MDGTVGKTAIDEQIIQLLVDKNIPYIVAYNKADLGATAEDDGLVVSALTGDGVWELKERMARLVKTREQTGKLVSDLVRPGDVLILVVPIDKSAPKGRLILPQQQVIRDALEAGAMPMVTRETEYPMALERLGRKPALVVTDSQVFGVVSKATPEDVPLTSFSILMARYKGFLEDAVRGAAALNALQDGDRILIAEGCTHHRQCEDIGTVKLPRWLREYSGADLQFDTCSGREFPEDLSPYRLVVHCGGCMLNGRELDYRRKCAADSGVPFTNYGTAIAQVHGILKRSLEKFPALAALLP